jgi:hypothetical protein
MKNEFYEKLKAAQGSFVSQVGEIIQGFPEFKDSNPAVKIMIYNVPVASMPEGSNNRQSDDGIRHWMSYWENIGFPELYSVNRKVKVVFEDEPETSIQP